MTLTCNHCNKTFSSKRNCKNHISKNVCKKGDKRCKYCGRNFKASNNMYRHINLYCDIKKQNDKQKDEILERLIKLEEENKQLKKKITKIEKTDKKTKINKTTNINTNNGAINNGTVINNHINLVAFGREDMTKIDKKEILMILRKGYDSTLRLTETVHFNPKYPEYHNVYITNMKDKYAMMYDGKSWNLTIKEDLINRLYDDKKDYIEENVEDFVKFLTKSQKNALDRWANTDEEDKKIKRLKERIKLLLYNSRDVPINTQKHIDNYKVLVARKCINDENVLQEVV